MCLPSLHPNQQRIIAAIQSATQQLGMRDNLTIIGGLGRYLGGDMKPPGDIDVKIDATLCGEYWSFLEVLAKHEITSVWDVLEPPTSFQWDPCHHLIGHALSLTIDCLANLRGEKHPNLDVKLVNLDAIPSSRFWVGLLNPHQLRQMDQAGKDKAILTARTTDKRLTIIYVPSIGAQSQDLAVDLGQFSGPVGARWYNPTDGRFKAIGDKPFLNRATHLFSTPGDNGTKANDWLLILRVH